MASDERIKERIARLIAYAERLNARLEAQPKHPKAKGWRRSLDEARVSLENLQQFGTEEPPSGLPTGVKIDVPKGLFSVTGHAPSGRA